MRPVRLEMHGFASFREPTTVDFTGAEYFALVGPTGAGKSTVIDALSFALYGSVPRWDNVRTVGMALAPTVGRGTVRLVFDVGSGATGGGRYVVARELRRAASGSVSVRTARLERLRDAAGLGELEEESEPLADGAGATTAAVEALLGLPFAEFCTCVVLPQGEFAEFLHTEPRKRQEKLVRILGLGVYDTIAREANTEAAAQRQRAEVLGEQLGGYADATVEAQEAAGARVVVLAALAERVAVAVPELAAAAADRRAALEQAERLRAEQARLATLRAPDGLAELASRRAGAVAAAGAAAALTADADTADAAARAALAAAPARGPLEQAVRHHTELAACETELPGALDRREKAGSAFELAARDAADALAAHDTARVALETATTTHATAEQAAQRLRAERSALRSLAAPAGLDALAGRESAAAGAHERAVAALGSAERAEAVAREDVGAGAPRAVLERARRDLDELSAAEQERVSAIEGSAAAQAAATAAEAAVETALHRRDHARSAQATAVRSGLAATLRRSLVEGDECPVCAQAVRTLPEPVSGSHATADTTADADAALASAESAYERARAAAAGAATGATRAQGEVERQESSISRLRAALAGSVPGVDGVPSRAEIAGATAALDRREEQLAAGVAAVQEARRAATTAAAALEDVRAETAAAGVALRAARDPLVPLGAPAAGADLFASWSELLAWSAAQAATREAELPAAAAAAATAEQARFGAEEALRTAERIARDRRTAETAAARAEQESRAAAEAVERRAALLRVELTGAPARAEAQTTLARIAELDRAADAADQALRVARREQRLADTAAADVEREVAAGWRALRSARDPVVPLGVPALDESDDLHTGWRTLLSWAERATAERSEQSAASEQAAATAEAAAAAVEQQVAAELAEHGVAVPAGRPEAVVLPAVATAVERARAAEERVAERRAAGAALLAEKERADEAHQVAKMLGGLLRSDAFPRWLVASALDALVADASASLAELSGGQFELTHAGGEFLVVDHADADAQRPVKTLSGGETFQASLALALALSTQMSTMAAGGAARLESIFLDEGFGTLDESNLETVAATLENLAGRGDRMVGVITHVPALAERVPVRFVVSRDQRTSSVSRESV